jgi:hypothetical protein
MLRKRLVHIHLLPLLPFPLPLFFFLLTFPVETLQDPGQKMIATHKQQAHPRTITQTTTNTTHTFTNHTYKKNNTAMRYLIHFSLLSLSSALLMHCTGKICPIHPFSRTTSP